MQTLLAIGAFVFAYMEFKRWRNELLGSKRIELAIKLGKSALEVKQAFKEARNPLGTGAPEYKPESTLAEKRRQDLEYDYNQRLQRISDKLEKLYDARWEISILFSENENIEEYVKVYNAQFHTLQVAMFSVLNDPNAKDFVDTIYGGLKPNDEFSRPIEDATNKLLEIARRYTR